jgi:hypothetical protein
MDPRVCPRLYIEISIPRFDFGIGLQGPLMGRVTGSDTLLNARSLKPFKIVEFPVQFWKMKKKS